MSEIMNLVQTMSEIIYLVNSDYSKNGNYFKNDKFNETQSNEIMPVCQAWMKSPCKLSELIMRSVLPGVYTVVHKKTW